MFSRRRRRCNNSVFVLSHTLTHTDTQFFEFFYGAVEWRIASMSDQSKLFECFFSMTVDLSDVGAPLIEGKFPSDSLLPQGITKFLFPELESVSKFGTDRFFFYLKELDIYSFCLRTLFSSTNCSCVCVLSKRCWPNVFFGLLDTQGRIADVDKHSTILFKKLLSSPIPEPGRAYKISIPDSIDPIIFRIPRTRYFYGEVQVKSLFESVSNPIVANVLCAMMLERRMIFHASSLQKLSYALHAMLSLLFPFKFEYLIIPVLPYSLIDYTMAPFPFVIAVHSSLLSKIKELQLEEVVFVDLDNGTASLSVSDLKVLPKDEISRLVEDLSRAKKEYGIGGQWNEAVQESFLSFFVELFGTYRNFCGEDEDEEFDKEGFLRTSSKSSRLFLEQVLETQLFSCFYQRRMVKDFKLDDFERKCEESNTSSGISILGRTIRNFFEDTIDALSDESPMSTPVKKKDNSRAFLLSDNGNSTPKRQAGSSQLVDLKHATPLKSLMEMEMEDDGEAKQQEKREEQKGATEKNLLLFEEDAPQQNLLSFDESPNLLSFDNSQQSSHVSTKETSDLISFF